MTDPDHVPSSAVDGKPRRSIVVPVLILTLGALEVLILYVLIAVETPLAPTVRRAIRNPFGLFAVVASVVTVLCYGVAGVLWWLERSARRRVRGR